MQKDMTKEILNYELTSKYDVNKNRIKSIEVSSMQSCANVWVNNIVYTYDIDDRLSKIGYGNYIAEYTYDDLDRISKREVGDLKQEENYVYDTYIANGEVYTTNRLLRIEDNARYSFGARTSTYDSNGRISSVSYNDNTYTYTYDALGRLVSENADGNVKTYTYDEYNNIQKTGLTYTNGVLTQANGRTIAYDELGNPTTYKGNTFTWEQGRKLVSGSMDGDNFTYAYDGNGMRYKKTVNGLTTEYYWNGTQLLYENRTFENNERIFYIYDVTGIAGMLYNYSYYYFDKNTLGDVTAIRDNSGNIIATYEYDAWGNHTVLNANGSIDYSANSIGNINPFRYRGYYYDTETGFYYLQTRYYDPTICRFINADNYELVGLLASTKELNMYAYCGNNPIMNVDASGEGIFATILLGALFGAVISGGFAVAGEVATNGLNVEKWNWGQIGLSALGGGVAGAISAIPLGGWLGALGFGGAGAVVGGVITGSVNNVETFFTALTIGAVANLIGYGINAGIAKYKAGTIYNLGNKAKSLAVQQLQAHPMNMGAVALKGSYRNAFKNISQKEIQKILMNANFWLSNSVFSSITSSSLSGWY